MTWSPCSLRRLHADDDGFLADIEMAEAADQTHAVELAGLLLEAADQQHVGVELLAARRGLDARCGWLDTGPSAFRWLAHRGAAFVFSRVRETCRVVASAAPSWQAFDACDCRD